MDDICITDITDDPIRVQFNGGDDQHFTLDSQCGIIALTLQVSTEFGATNSDTIHLSLDFGSDTADDDGSVFNIVGDSNFDANGDLFIPAGVLGANPAQYIIELQFDGSQNAGTNYSIDIEVNQNSLTGSICHHPWAWAQTCAAPSFTLSTDGEWSCPADGETIDLAIDSQCNHDYVFSWEGPNGFTAATEDVTVFEHGVYTVVITDENGCEYEEEIEVESSDAEAPTLTCNGPYNASSDDNCNIVLGDYTTQVTASDNCGNVTITQTPLAGTEITWTFMPVINTATDDAGNETSCSFNVWNNTANVVTNTNSEDWSNGTFHFAGDWTFTNGVNYTINNSTFFFSSISDLIIEDGSSVVFQNCSFLVCDDTWNGINLIGDNNELIPSLSMTDCYLEYAWQGVHNDGSAGPGGNLFIGKNNTFHNCVQAIFVNSVVPSLANGIGS